MRVPFSALLLAALPLAAAAQTPTTPAPGTVTAEATEIVRAKPDRARLAYTVTYRSGEATAATDENEAMTKEFVESVDKLKLKGVKAAGGALRVDKVETQAINGINQQFIPQFNAARQVVVTVADPNPDTLLATVDKVQQAAAKLGISGEVGNASYNGRAYERVAAGKVTYSREDGWDDLSAAALTKATKRARERAEAMAAGAGLKLGEVVSIAEPDGPQSVTTYNYSGSGSSGVSQAADAQEVYVDGELIRKIRVRVVYTTTK
jgi:uncharacterized protein YggE